MHKWALSAILLVACSNSAASTQIPPTATVQLRASLIATKTTLAPTATARPNTVEWRTVRNGIELAILNANVHSLNQSHPMMVARIDPSKVDVRVNYAPSAPQRVRDWLNSSDVDLVINAGFFTEQKQATGLLISDGKSFGSTYKGFGGMFAMRDGKPSLQWLAAQPYQADKRISQAVQSFPMLARGSVIVQGISTDERHNLRTFVALDRSGRMLLGVCQTPAWTLLDLAEFLAAEPSLNIESALNLDGGASTGMWLRDVNDVMLTDSFDTVPSVITVKSKK
jgi:uncharacterized protein YigE (DUF2233 family)